MSGIPFNPNEPNRDAAACRCGCGFDTMDYELVELLKRVSRRFNVDEIVINSWCRCEQHNAAVGGAPTSQHLRGRAADIVVPGVPAAEVAEYLDSIDPGAYGLGRYNTFTHIDTRGYKARWQR